MAYQVLARKYRPQRFSDVVGQEHVTQTLSNAIRQQRIAHAYLFVGPRGTGKTTIARIFAKCLNCTGGPLAEFAEDDPRCQEIAEGRSLDVLEIDGASNRGIDEIRELRETVKYAPATSKFKIYIIDEVHMLTKEAFNALLKTLEEPPEHVKFMFATTEPEKILPTILSRCQRFDLRRIPVTLIASHLDFIARQEKVRVDAQALTAVARGADGCMRDAESALDQLISFCGDAVVEQDVLSMFGLTAQSQIMKLAGGVFNGEAETVLVELNELARQGKDLGRLLSDLLNHCRNVLIHLVARGDASLLEATETEIESIRSHANLVGADTLTRIMDVLTNAEGRFRDAASKKIFLEITLLRAIQMRNEVPIETVLNQLQQLRDPTGGPAAPQASSPAQAARPAPRKSTSAPPAAAQHQDTLRETAPSRAESTAGERAKDAAMAASPASPASSASKPDPETHPMEHLWRELLEAVGRASAFTRSYLVEAHPVSMSGATLTIGFDPEFSDQLELVNNQRTLTLLQTKLKELGHPGMQAKFVLDQAPVGREKPAFALPKTPAPAPAPSTDPDTGNTASVPSYLGATPRPPAAASPTARAAVAPDAAPASAPSTGTDFKNDPLILKALELFKGQIVDVRS